MTVKFTATFSFENFLTIFIHLLNILFQLLSSYWYLKRRVRITWLIRLQSSRELQLQGTWWGHLQSWLCSWCSGIQAQVQCYFNTYHDPRFPFFRITKISGNLRRGRMILKTPSRKKLRRKRRKRKYSLWFEK